MDYQVILGRHARRDLQAVVRFISLDSPELALRFAQFLISATKQVAHFPEMGRLVPELHGSSAREIVVRSYRIIYRADHANRTVQISRFWHASSRNAQTRRLMPRFPKVSA